MQLVPPGVGTTNQDAQEVNLDRRRDGQLDRQRAARAPVTLDRAQPRTRASTARTTARCRACACACRRASRPAAARPSSATSSSSRARPRSGCSARTTPAAETHAVVGRARRDRHRRPTAAPATRPTRACRGASHDAGRPRPVRHRAQRRRPADASASATTRSCRSSGGLNDGEQPTIERGPINAAAPPTAPAPAGRTRSASRASTSRTCSRSARRTTATSSPRPSTTSACTRSCQAIRHRLREPDVVAVQEVAVFADGANALTGLAAALGNYTGYITTNNDGRGIATGFLVKNGTTATNGRLIGKDAPSPWGSSTRLRPAPGPAVRPRAVRARPQEGRPVVHGDEQPLGVAVARDAVPHRGGEVRPRRRPRRCSSRAATCSWRAT